MIIKTTNVLPLLLSIGIIAVLSVTGIPHGYAQTDTIPPLILKSPDDYEITTDQLPHPYQVRTSNFVTVDDSGQSTNLYCGLDSESRDYVSSRKTWYLEEGEYTINCDIKDQSNNISTVSWQLNVFADDLAPAWVKTVGGLYCNNTLNEELYLKVIKYLQVADVMIFDIQGSGYGEVPDDFKSNTCNWKSGSVSNGQYKTILEDMADNGIFQNVTF